MKKFLSFILILLLLIPQTVFAKNTDITHEQYINHLIKDISSNWTLDYYDKITFNLNYDLIQKDGKSITFEYLKEILNIEADDINDLYSQIKENHLYDIRENKEKITIRNPYQTCRIYIESIYDINLNKNYNYIPYDNKHGVIICNTQEETYLTYHELISETNFTSITLDELVSANSMTLPPKPNNSEYYSYGFDQMNINSLKEKSKEKVTVAIIDSGYAKEHQFFKDRVFFNGISFITGKSVIDDSYGHGTHVTSTIIEGTTSNVSILPIQVFDQNKTTSFLVVDTALKYALSQNVDCINMSLGFNQEYINQYNFLDHSLYELYLNNIIFIKSAGNSNKIVQIDYPYGKYVISVGSANKDNKVSYFSNYGFDLDFVSYGENILGALINLSMGTKSGTSMAAPHITAAVALLKSEDKTRSFDEIYKILQENCIEIESEKDIGHGLPVF